jgi:hypothetical protein
MGLVIPAQAGIQEFFASGKYQLRDPPVRPFRGMRVSADFSRTAIDNERIHLVCYWNVADERHS